jgi:hypothetical protein
VICKHSKNKDNVAVTAFCHARQGLKIFTLYYCIVLMAFVQSITGNALIDLNAKTASYGRINHLFNVYRIIHGISSTI